MLPPVTSPAANKKQAPEVDTAGAISNLVSGWTLEEFTLAATHRLRACQCSACLSALVNVTDNFWAARMLTVGPATEYEAQAAKVLLAVQSWWRESTDGAFSPLQREQPE